MFNSVQAPKTKMRIIYLLLALIICLSFFVASLFDVHQYPHDISLEYNESGAFALDGGYTSYKSQEKVLSDSTKYNLDLWASWNGNDEFTGYLTSTKFLAPKVLSLYISGYPNKEGNFLGLYCENHDTEFKLYSSDPGEKWVKYIWRVPKACAGSTVRIVATDLSTDVGGWLGLSTPITYDLNQAIEYEISVTKKLVYIPITLLICIIFICPGLLIMFYARINNYIDGSLHLILVFCFSSFVGYVCFYAYFLNPKIGVLHSWLITLTSLALATFLYVKNIEFRKITWNHSFLTPLLLMLITACFYQYILYFPYINLDNTSDSIIQTRFFDWQPPDNIIPRIFAEKLYNGQDPRNLLGDWLSSDRPPLQTGLLLFLLPLVKILNSDTISSIYYQGFGTFAQLFWIPTVYSLMRSYKLNPRKIIFLIFILSITGFFMFNSLFTWPKMLGASLSILSLIILNQNKSMYNDSYGSRSRLLAYFLVPFCLFLGILSHSGSIFLTPALLLALSREFRFFSRPCFLPSLIYKFLCNTKTLVTLALAFSLTLLPWLLYQKVYNPPADRLVKWFLGGTVEINNLSAFDVIKNSYGNLSLQEIIINKLENFLYLFGSYTEYLRFNFSSQTIRTNEFLYLFHSFGLFNLSLVVLSLAFILRVAFKFDFNNRLRLLVWKIMPNQYSELLFTPISCILVWILLLFDSKVSAASIHHGSYAVFTILFAFLAIYTFEILLRKRLLMFLFTGVYVYYFLRVWVLIDVPTMKNSVQLLSHSCNYIFALMFYTLLYYLVSIKIIMLDKSKSV